VPGSNRLIPFPGQGWDRQFSKSIMAFHENAGLRQVDFDLAFLKSPFPPRPNQPCRHPSIRTLSERLPRSVQAGCSRFSRCCHLFVDLSFHLAMEVGPGH
jgi:hypothetical protein